MTPESYLRELLATCGAYALSEHDRELLIHDTEGSIYTQLVRKSFRKWSIDDETREHVKKAIHAHLASGTPLHFTFPFGAYKRWNLPSAPWVDWAEVFSLAYYAAYMAPIAAAYAPGCEFSFVGDDVIVPRLNNYPVEEVKKWSESFEQLIEVFRRYLPSNMRFRLLHVRDFYSPGEFEQELDAKYAGGKAEWDSWDEVTRQAHIASSRHNIKWKGIHDWTGLSDEEKKAKILEAAILHNVYRQLPRRKAFTRGDDKICIFPRKISNAIPLGTTKNSSVFFWVGTGVLERRGETWQERILSYEQWQERKHELRNTTVSLDGFPLTSIQVDSRVDS
ncbi:MAG: hypothetical protein A2898_00530 [Candidatus Kerfeldbacteria bacterium RIFCSPLOWO2_01_FULL_48_11]|uniref:Uncharacterized protein n=1 Tax=Candidatus Kerfeldbacteria bacterium RIFCSPLOWO2_01_FULL_48_11 TaxID=1798543 RepID=A0A1G2B2N8_9BACT|nr:MAG: hypothetical protein UY34_C0019G0039 [Parcubacteria group bacterium GW2011_GWA2_48_9]KKW16053.1 MAG: hypothetical protein UY52_C0011G0041 [Parcubacteria group bacterium GW2011_GWC2_49_9]OGY82996.1 MAG: hypothetical protein A2898_00530 [Candidatus Kerfeldbacteria bacterium RIFCSPLOWO2_01_FULL_48_11]HCM67662.1 hypothetical protein [Candidatus Kerfeldbacteria bacterium]